MEITTEEYTLLFNTITDTINTLELARLNLVVAQQRAEEIFISKP